MVKNARNPASEPPHSRSLTTKERSRFMRNVMAQATAPRSFMCPASGTACKLRGCTKNICLVEKEKEIGSKIVEIKVERTKYWHPFDRQEVDDLMQEMAEYDVWVRFSSKPSDEHIRLLGRKRMRRYHDYYAERARSELPAIHERQRQAKAMLKSWKDQGMSDDLFAPNPD
jgi:hypothetical protein